ncbi:MAG TPA: FAD-binding oxidoreductase [Thermoanaerobaculia bacterium]|nr:FAD-binding oxidoreductase [Thermoanaerobaculia bacterium]
MALSGSALAFSQPEVYGRELVNDVHSALNPTWVEAVERPRSLVELQKLVYRVGRQGGTLSIAGGRHSMGGQQFGTGSVLIDTRGLDRVLAFNPEAGTIEVEAGIEWPELIERYTAIQRGSSRPWGIAQKQTGADRLTIGGSISCNAHGRGLTMKPLVGDIESLVLIDAQGEAVRCSRTQSPELFRLAVGGYGLFGVVYAATLRLKPRRKIRRVVEITGIEGLDEAFQRRIDDGFLYGDFQFAIDPRSEDFLRRGVFCCYRPVPDETPLPANQRELSDEDWKELLYLAHADKARAFGRYADHYLSTDGQVYESDTHQLSPYFDGYHLEIDRRTGAVHPASEVITELYVPRPDLAAFLTQAAASLREHGDEVIYGTVRLIERDDETFLPWAREPWACVVLNLHVVHTEEARQRAADAFRRLIDLAISHGGSFFLTYHRHATREQIDRCHPRLAEMLLRKLDHDPRELFRSDWYHHCRQLFA